MINPVNKALPTSEDDQREIATEGSKDSHRLRMPVDRTPERKVGPPLEPAVLSDLDAQPAVLPTIGDDGEAQFSGRPREAGGERPAHTPDHRRKPDLPDNG